VISADTISRLSQVSSFGEGESLRKLAFSPDGSLLASAGGNNEDFNIRLYAVASGQLLQVISGHTDIVWDIEFSADGQFFASVSSDRTAKVWNLNTEVPIQSIAFPNEVISVSFSPDSQVMAVGGVDNWPDAAIWTYSTANWQPITKLAALWNIPDIAYTADGQRLVGGGISRNVRVWNAVSGSELFVLNHSGQVSSIAISPDGSTVATGLCQDSDDNAVCTLGAVWLWNLQTGELIKQLSDFSTWAEDVAYSPDGSLLFAGSRDGALRVYDSSSYATLLSTSSAGGGGIMALSSDGRLLATAGFNGLIHLWQVGP
jgi:WD40 repeat protein